MAFAERNSKSCYHIGACISWSSNWNRHDCRYYNDNALATESMRVCISQYNQHHHSSQNDTSEHKGDFTITAPTLAVT